MRANKGTLMRWLLDCIKGWGWLPGEPTKPLEGWNFQLQGWETDGDSVQSAMANDLIIVPTWWSLHKNKWTGFRELPGEWTRGEEGKAWKSCAPFPIPCPMHLFHLAIPELYIFFIRNWWSSEQTGFLRSVSHSSNLIKPKESVKGTSDS